MATKSIEQWEKEKNVIVLGVSDLSKPVTEEKFETLRAKSSIVVDHGVRVEFLKANGYKITRENMINIDLSSKEAES